MSLLAEVVVEEWLNRQGYFTIRGIRLGVDEMDLLAVRPGADGNFECRHIEVQASMRPVSYISRLPKAVQKETGRGASTATRKDGELEQGVREWVEKKFSKSTKSAMRERLAPGPWTWELVIHRVKWDEEVRLIENEGVRILHLTDILRDLRAGESPIASASGADLLDLIHGTASDEHAAATEAPLSSVALPATVLR